MQVNTLQILLKESGLKLVPEEKLVDAYRSSGLAI